MRVRIWGARGSVPAPGPEMNRYGGNTSCVELTLASGETLILDAGTGIRTLGFSLPPDLPRINILLTHLHLDHIQGLMFFPPCFRAESNIRIFGPSSPEASLESRIARYISAPLSPVEVRELPCDVSFVDAPATEWQIGGATIRAEAITHRGPTLGYRITDGDTSLCYIPDHEPGLGADLAQLSEEWISGYNLARDSDLLIHDCQYTDEEYPGHEGWGIRRSTRPSPSRSASGRSERCCSTTTRSTPTASSTTCIVAPAGAGSPSAAIPGRSRWPPNAAS